MSAEQKQHIDPLPSLRAWLDLDDNGRVMTIVEDPSFTEYVNYLIEQFTTLESSERQAWWKADHENRRALRLEEQLEAAQRKQNEQIGRGNTAILQREARLRDLEEQYQAAVRALGCDHTLRAGEDQEGLWDYVHRDDGTWIKCRGCGTLERWEGGFRHEVKFEGVSSPAKEPS